MEFPGTFSEKFPSMSVMVPNPVFPFTDTLAPGIPMPASSSTCPVTVMSACCCVSFTDRLLPVSAAYSGKNIPSADTSKTPAHRVPAQFVFP